MNRDIYNQLCHVFQGIKEIKDTQQVIIDNLNGVRHWEQGMCELCIVNRASYRVIQIDHPDRTIDVCGSCAIDITNPPGGSRSKWRRESIFK